jgi:PleD family two-component response regulator
MRVETPQGELSVTVSLGCAKALADGDLLSSADEALYAAKRAGRDRVHTLGRAAVAA